MSNFSYDFVGKKVLVMGLGRFGGGVDVATFVAEKGANVIVTDLASTNQLESSINELRDFSNIEFHLGCHDESDFKNADIVIANPAVPGDNKYLKISRNAGKLVTSQINIFFELCPAKIIGITGANGKSTTTSLTAHLLRTQNTEYRIQNTENHPQASLEAATLDTSHESRATSNNYVIASLPPRSEAKSPGWHAPQSQFTQDAERTTHYEHVWLSGNIGNQPLLTILNKINPDDLVVLELSSFQIEQLAEFQQAPDIALLTNLTPNHLDRYSTFEKYCDAKENIFKYQKLDENNPAISIFNAEDEIANQWNEKYKNDKGRNCVKFSADDVPEDIRNYYKLPGRANLSNLAAALTIAKIFNIDDESIKKSLTEFKALPHRLELVDEINGVKWYNDSKATTPEGAIIALDAFDEPIILIAGGYDKNLPFDKLAEKIVEKTKAVILIGQTAPKISDAIPKANILLSRVAATEQSEVDGPSTSLHSVAATRLECVNSLHDAVKKANNLAKPGDVILFSPACASYDMFENYEQRGMEFIKLVKSLKK